MRKKTIHLIIIFTFILTFLAAISVYPRYFNSGVNFLNEKFSLDLPLFSEKPYKLRYDLKGGTWFLYEVDFLRQDGGNILQGLEDIIEKRISKVGIEEFSVKTKKLAGPCQLIIEVIGEDVEENMVEIIERPPFVEFREQRSEEETEKLLQKQEEAMGKSFEELQEMEEWYLAFEDPYFKPTALSGEHLDKIELLFNRETLKPVISLEFNEEGARIFEDLTSKNIDKFLAIYIDQDLVSSFSVREKISGGRTQLSGDFGLKQAEVMAGSLEAAAFWDRARLISQKTASPTDAALALKNILQAGLVAFLAVTFFMIIIYRLFGVLASIGLGICLLLIGALVKLIPITLSTFGILGFIVAIGIYANIHMLVFSRIRKELQEKKIFSIGLRQGFQKSWFLVRNNFLIILIISLLLFFEGPESVLDFTLSFVLGVLVTIFCTIFITRIFLRCCEGTRIEQWSWLWNKI